MRNDVSRLRTRIGDNGMDYKGYNIAVHEFGHNVEQTITMNDVDYYVLNVYLILHLQKQLHSSSKSVTWNCLAYKIPILTMSIIWHLTIFGQVMRLWAYH